MVIEIAMNWERQEGRATNDEELKNELESKDEM